MKLTARQESVLQRIADSAASSRVRVVGVALGGPVLSLGKQARLVLLTPEGDLENVSELDVATT